MDSENFTNEFLRFIAQSPYSEMFPLIDRVKQTSKGTIRIEMTDGRNFLIVMIDDNA